MDAPSCWRLCVDMFACGAVHKGLAKNKRETEVPSGRHLSGKQRMNEAKSPGRSRQLSCQGEAQSSIVPQNVSKR
jgi:hypothetical protein